MYNDAIEALREERELMLALGRITSARKLMDQIQDLLRQAKSKKK